MTSFNFVGRRLLYPLATPAIAIGVFMLVQYHAGWNVFGNPDPKEFPLLSAILAGTGLVAYLVGKAMTVHVSSDGVSFGIFPVIKRIPLASIVDVVGQPGPGEEVRESAGRVRFLRLLTPTGDVEVPLPRSYRDKVLAAIRDASEHSEQ